MQPEPEKPEPGPRRWLKPGQHFDQFVDADTGWEEGSTLREQAKVEAAKRNYLVSARVRAEQGRYSISTATLADKTGLSVHQVRRILRGESHMSFDVAEALAQAIGWRTTFNIRPPQPPAQSTNDQPGPPGGLNTDDRK